MPIKFKYKELHQYLFAIYYYLAVPYNVNNIRDPEYNTSEYVLKVAVGIDIVV